MSQDNAVPSSASLCQVMTTDRDSTAIHYEACAVGRSRGSLCNSLELLTRSLVVSVPWL